MPGTTARVRHRPLVRLVSSSHRDEQARRNRQACKQRLVREGKAHAALVFDGDLAVASCQFGAVPGEPAHSSPRPIRSCRPCGAAVAAVSPDSRRRPAGPTDGGDNLACIADGRCYGIPRRKSF